MKILFRQRIDIKLFLNPKKGHINKSKNIQRKECSITKSKFSKNRRNS